MLVIFCGVGEAFDENLYNTSILLINSQKESLLLDCGYTAAHAFWKASPNPLNLDAIYISHLHGDHFLGLSLLLLRFYEENRTKELYIFGPKQIKEKTIQSLETAYPSIKEKLPFALHFQEVEGYQNISFKNFNLFLIPSTHSITSNGIVVATNNKKVYYSGDGKIENNDLKFLTDIDLLILETYKLSSEVPGHNSIKQALKIAKQVNCPQLALVHLNRKTRKDKKLFLDILKEKQDITLFLPTENSCIFL